MLSQDVTQACPMPPKKPPRHVVPAATAKALLVLVWFVLFVVWFVLFVVWFGAFVALVLGQSSVVLMSLPGVAEMVVPSSFEPLSVLLWLLEPWPVGL